MSAEDLSSRFTNEYSFARFGEGLSALKKYQSGQQVIDLALAAAAFENATREFPEDRIHHYYLGLIRLEQASLLPEDNTSRDRDPLERRIDQAVSSFERYQQDRSDHGLDARRFYWADYNRAAGYVHRLDWQGYLCARSILAPYLIDSPDLPAKAPSWRARSTAPTHAKSGRELVESANFEADLFGNLRELGNSIAQRLIVKLLSFYSDGKERRRKLAQRFAAADAILFTLSAESLYLLTRVRPMREPLSILHKPDLGLETIDEVSEAIHVFANKMSQSLSTSRAQAELSAESRSSLESDLQNHRGHLECAKALALASAELISQHASSDGEDAFVTIMFQLRNSPERTNAEAYLSAAAEYFLESLSIQPGWIPAMKNLKNAYIALGDQESASAITAPTWSWPQNADAFINQFLTTPKPTTTGPVNAPVASLQTSPTNP